MAPTGLETLVHIIIGQYFTIAKCLLVFRDNLNFNYNGEMPFVEIGVSNGTYDSRLVFGSYGCQGIILNVQDPSLVLQKLEEDIKKSSERFNERKYLILPVSSQEEALDIFQTDSVEFISDILVIRSLKQVDEYNPWSVGEDDAFELYTHDIMGLNGTSILVDTWDFEGFKFNEDLFPRKPSNGYGRIIRLATFSYKPYSLPRIGTGTELILAHEFCKKMNLTPIFVIDEEGEWGDIYENWTGVGLMGNLVEDRADIGFAALYSWYSAYQYLDLSKPVIRTGVTCLTPAPSLAGGWLVPLFSFTYDMWIAVAFSFLLCNAALFFIDIYKLTGKVDKGEAGRDAVMNTAAVFLQQSVDDGPSQGRAKNSMYMCMFVFSLMICSTYSSGLASSMTVPRYVGAIKTVQDLVDSGIQWGATSIAWLMSIMDTQEENYQILLERFVNTDAKRLEENNDKRFAFSLERLPAGYFAIGDYITENGISHLRLMTEDIYWEQVVFMTRKSSIWLPVLNDFILRLGQSGIPYFWEYQVATTHLNARIQRAVKFSHAGGDGDGSPKKLKWTHVQGAYAIWTLGLTASLLCFLYEILTTKFRRMKIVVPS